jgi:hypothetical protein
LDREIRLIQDETLLLGSLVEQAVLNAVDALKSRDVAAPGQSFESTWSSMTSVSRLKTAS